MTEYPKVIRVDGICVTVPNALEEARWMASLVPEVKVASTVVVIDHSHDKHDKDEKPKKPKK